MDNIAPAEVNATVHQLAAACKKYKRIVFTDKDGNIVDDANDDENADQNTLELQEWTCTRHKRKHKQKQK